MPPLTRRNRPLARAFGQFAAVVAFLAQLAVLGAGLAEGRGGVGYGAHFDNGGTSAHYVHDEALCAACQARSLHGVARLPQRAPAPASPRIAAVAPSPTPLVGRELDPTNPSRAPPTLI